MERFAAGSYTFSVWMTKMAYLNLLWIFFTIAGFILFGWMPATSAMFGVVRKWHLGDADIPITATFWDVYKKEFVRANILGLVLFVIGYLLVVEFQILRAQDSLMYVIVTFGVIVILAMYLMVLMYFFPVFVHFDLRLVDYLKWPFIIGIVHPLLTVFLFTVLGLGLYVVFTTIPALLFFFGGSMTAYLMMWGVSKTFSKYELQDG